VGDRLDGRDQENAPGMQSVSLRAGRLSVAKMFYNSRLQEQSAFTQLTALIYCKQQGFTHSRNTYIHDISTYISGQYIFYNVYLKNGLWYF
jgi:hypothetical protein